MNINRINLNTNLYSFKGDKKDTTEAEPKKSFMELLSEINIEAQNSKTSLTDAIRMKEAENGAKQVPVDYNLFIDA